jgi:acetyl esterase/lipase
MDAARDANTAIEWVRKNSKKYRIDTDHIFVAGGSAGGRTAITVAEFPGPDPSARYKPETEFTSKKWNKKGIIAAAILWGGPEKEMRDWVYPYLNKKSIPAVIIHGDSDKTIPVQNSIDLNDAMQKADITTELHILPGAAHTPVGKTTDPLIEDWTARFFVNEWKKKL